MLIHLTTKYLHISDIFIFNHDEASRKKAAHLKALNAKCLKVRGLLAEALKENKVRTAICQQLLVSLKKILDGTEETKVTNKAVIPLKTLRKILPSQSNLKSTWEAVCEMIVACDSFLANDLGNLTVTASLEYLDKFRNEVSEKEKICISKLKSDEERLMSQGVFSKLKKAIDRIAELHSEAIRDYDVQKDFSHAISFDRRAFTQVLISKRRWLETKIEAINDGKITGNRLVEFLVQARDFFTILDCFSSLKELVNSIVQGVDTDNRTRPALRIPLRVLFETRMNFSILGEAGAGKTTSLERYEKSEKSKDDRTTIFIPLSELTRIKDRPILGDDLTARLTARNLLSRPPHRGRSERGSALGSEGVWW